MLVVEGFGVRGPRGWAFRGVEFRAEQGELIAVEGPSGSGRTSLLLALTGRMRATEGHADIAVGAGSRTGSLRLPKQAAAVRRISAVAHVPGVTDLDPALTVAEHLHERALLQRRFGGSLRALLRPRAERANASALLRERALAAAGLDPATLAKGSRTAVRDLERIEALRLSVALALIGRPRLLAVDDLGLKLSADELAAAWRMLAGIATDGTTVLAVGHAAPSSVQRVHLTDVTASEAGTADAAETEPQPAAADADKTRPAADPAPVPALAPTPETEKEAADALAETGRS
ncbi:ABC transporter [Streptomyces indicus]|uniref:ABC transporter n=1 Tax=Streptomyces indicus TaxID=417292 RepID=A0A1G8YY11_9ACTN|nr:ATP-binding cassette domain-containing protein [Streptomyces indicus]SDK07294.1 ABC transporter [Streptomyces indicus]